MYTTIGKWLYDYRIANGMNQNSMAKLIGVHRITYCHWEDEFNQHNDERFSTDSLQKIAQATNVSIDYLLGLSEYKHPEDASAIEVLGLSEQAIEAIKEYDSEHKELIERLINHKDRDMLLWLLDLVLDYATVYKKTNQYRIINTDTNKKLSARDSIDLIQGNELNSIRDNFTDLLKMMNLAYSDKSEEYYSKLIEQEQKQLQ